MEANTITAKCLNPDDRVKRLTDEFRTAMKAVPKDAVVRCVLRTPSHAGRGLHRRFSNVAALMKRAIVAADDFFVAGVKAARQGYGHEFSRDSLVRGKEVIGRGWQVTHGVATQIPRWSRSLVSDPSESLPEVVGATVGFLIGSGGLDANGGLPDLDLLAGIGNHRSFLTHSIIMGAAAEAVLIALDELILLTHEYLPNDRDPLWDSLVQVYRRTSAGAKTGVAVGIAYHLAVDGTLQVAAYKDLPFHAPMEVHQALFEANAATETLNATKGQQA